MAAPARATCSTNAIPRARLASGSGVQAICTTASVNFFGVSIAKRVQDSCRSSKPPASSQLVITLTPPEVAAQRRLG